MHGPLEDAARRGGAATRISLGSGTTTDDDVECSQAAMLRVAGGTCRQRAG